MNSFAKTYVGLDRANRYIFENEIRPRVTESLVDEHKRKPVGRHSSDLDIVLQYLRRSAESERPRYFLVMTRAETLWCIGTHSRVRGQAVQIHKDKCFTSVDEAEHAVFLMRLADLGVTR